MIAVSATGLLVGKSRYGTDILVSYLCVLVFSVYLSWPGLRLLRGDGHRLYDNTVSSVWRDRDLPASSICVQVLSNFVVTTAYGQLLVINTSYIIVSPVFIIIIVFMIGLWLKLGEKKLEESPRQLGTLLFVALFPYVLLLCEMLMKDRGDDLALSHFLLFLSSALGAVAVMVSNLKHVDAGSAALHFLQKTCTVLLIATLHVMAAKWLGMEGTVLVCMPELTAMLLWFSDVDHSWYKKAEEYIKLLFTSLKDKLPLVSLAIGILAFLMAFIVDNIHSHIQVFWYSKMDFGMVTAVALYLFDFWMIYLWPGSICNSK